MVFYSNQKIRQKGPNIRTTMRAYASFNSCEGF
jgi:hypothetical protein